jgi:PAS domain-containing protein
MISRYPTDEQLSDVFNNASTALAVKGEDGGLTYNAAAIALFGDDSKIEQCVALLGRKCRPGSELANELVDTGNGAYPLAIANAATHKTSWGTRLYVAARPQLSSALPSSRTPRSAVGPEAKTWIDAVASSEADPVTDGELLRDVFDRAPVAIHVIASDGTVVAANPRDIDLVGASDDVDQYVGRHIRRIYADQDVVDDFLARWTTDGPIIDFRAHFLDKATKKPVVIFSTAQVEADRLVNTRCFVFDDEHPTWPRDEVMEVLQP